MALRIIKLIDYVDQNNACTFKQGEDFRATYLAPILREVMGSGETLEINLDGYYGFTPQFLKGAFASSTSISRKDFESVVRFRCMDEPGLAKRIHDYIEGAEFSEELRQEVRKRPEIVRLSVLGSIWTIQSKRLEEDKMLEACDGYSDKSVREIVVRYFDPDPEKLRDLSAYSKKVLRHEIVHAFLHESGLSENSSSTDAWAANEEMVDWMAIQGPKIHQAWQEAGALQ